MRADQLYKKRMLVMSKSTRAFEAARAMRERFTGCALVSDGRGAIIGLVTDRDLACGVLAERLSPDTPLIDVMATNIKTVGEGDKLSRVLQIMQRYGVRRVPVMRLTDAGKEQCVGIYTLDDLILWGDVPVSDLRSIVRKQLRPSPRKVRNNFRKNRWRSENTLARFNKVMASEMGLEEKLAGGVTLTILEDVVQRVPSAVASNFIAGLPKLIKEELDHPRGISVRPLKLQEVKRDLARRYCLRKRQVDTLLPHFWHGLEVNMKNHVPKHLLSALPQEFQLAFLAPQSSKRVA